MGSAFFAFLDEAVDEGDEFFCATRQDESGGGGIPVEFEAGGESGYPELTDGCVGGDNELARRLVKQDIQHTVLLLDFKAWVFFLFALNEMPLESVESRLADAAELLFIDHGLSVTRRSEKVLVPNQPRALNPASYRQTRREHPSG